MLQISLWKRLVILGLCLAALITAAPNMFYARVEGHNDAVSAFEKTGAMTETQEAAKAAWPDWAPSALVNLGLDLRGGAHLLAEVHLGEVYKARMDALWPEVRKVLAAERATIGAIRRVPSPEGELRIQIGERAQIARAVEVARTLASPVVSLTGVGQTDYEVTGEGDTVVFRLSEAEKKATDDRTMQQSLEIVRRRVDAAGTREPTIMREGTDRILIEVPGIGSAQELKDLIGTTAKLTFHPVLSTTSNPNAPVASGNELLPDAERQGLYHLLDEVPVVTGDDLTDARPTTDDNGAPAVSFRFNVSGARAFGDYTAGHIGEPFAIVLDGKVISAPTIQAHIAGGSGIITGRFSIEEATDLALLLRAGALPAGMTFLEERTIGPELGADSVKAGMVASVIGFVAVVAYMIASYGLFGFFSSVALFINIAFIFAVMGAIGGTMTLPGIAGIVLTIGTSVDANVLIYERMREEIRSGKSPVRAIELGFDKAMSAIIDANVTSFLSSAILFVLGAGPVRGFAVTTMIGIAASIFTAIWVVRLMIVIWYGWRRPKTIVI
ncbi:protein translocase subunit SecD [Rhodobacter capsulatus]|uniref:Protein translocase subunit SecD n=1 Tax=Rhodobacter capsulatus (strain ATCC BAA-309 / NBRC 16581 / SB1003) TaxID=272942 RepID=SECD_RHOCB|nr:protein translocase subunit SecD [Rhodobacter capsulatus]O33517.1 RecName: Full=Protein translocase subunit SecD [Rhodobacter capsulatus SB 1003]AAB62801.1 SecD [Rhodobacter capsulatus SB 1003]ADE85527.1 protein-export membrane protein SecD [Rhodobacter capsulatus SB 1003]ETD01561.1 preprotein translocase subunit SecD [Rhodobacter capsulatus DE442]ETD76628.1 preprotein translocase subunit SecD [Rhodobacter capsulatus R121]ETE53464.1 preprotein translocase subunit SecD [Rhodobacter capsulat